MNNQFDKDKFEAAFKTFIETLQKNINEHHNKTPSTLPAPNITHMSGKKYLRIVIDSFGSKSVYCFVEILTGDILKSETWAKPAKHPRGSIYSKEHGMECCGPYGVQYLTGYTVQVFAPQSLD